MDIQKIMKNQISHLEKTPVTQLNEMLSKQGKNPTFKDVSNPNFQCRVQCDDFWGKLN